MIAIALSVAIAAGEWTQKDTLAEATFTVLAVGDLAETAWSTHRFRLAESNPLMGRHPSIERVCAVGAGELLAHVGIAYLLPGEWRTAWQWAWVGIEFEAIRGNLLLLGGRF